jgi:hypothetical protein
MKTMFEIGEKVERIGISVSIFTLGTANSAFSLVFYVRISEIRANPLKYTDPDGEITIYFGVTAQAGAGTGGQIGKGLFISFGKSELKLGAYTTKSLGAEYGVQAGAGFVFGVDKNNDISGDSLTIGGSGGEGIYFGSDTSISLGTGSDGKAEFSGISFDIGLGGGSPIEGHINYTHTKISEIDGAEIARNVKDEIVRRVFESLPPPEFWQQ